MRWVALFAFAAAAIAHAAPPPTVAVLPFATTDLRVELWGEALPSSRGTRAGARCRSTPTEVLCHLHDQEGECAIFAFH